MCESGVTDAESTDDDLVSASEPAVVRVFDGYLRLNLV